MTSLRTWLRSSTLLISVVALPAAGADRLTPGKSETDWNWHTAWSRDPGAITSSWDRAQEPAVARVVHRGNADWSLDPGRRFTVEEGDILELSAEVLVRGPGTVTIAHTTRDAGGNVVEWSAGDASARERPAWTPLRSRWIVPPGTREAAPRLIGTGPVEVSMRGFRLASGGTLSALLSGAAPAATVSNALLALTVEPPHGAWRLTDLRSGRSWRQSDPNRGMILASARADNGVLRVSLRDLAGDRTLAVTVRPEAGRAELEVELAAEGPMSSELAYPCAFDTAAGDRLVVPLNEGIGWPVDDAAVTPMRLVAYGGHGICMSFWGQTDGTNSLMAILETPDDAQLRTYRADGGLLRAGPVWVPQKGRFGYARRIRYVAFDRGDHVAMCKRYRAYAAETGRLKTFAQKRAERPGVDLLAGAVNVWYFGKDALTAAREMQAAGIDRILWSAAGPAGQIKAMNDMGLLTSRYDIYQDVMDPAQFPKIRGVHGDWPTEGWPRDIVIDERGQWAHGWSVDAKDGGPRIPCGVICDLRVPDYARTRMAAELAEKPYRCRFIDTTTASAWRECWAPEHPMTRSDSREGRMKLLGLVSGGFKLLCGSETGHDAAVPVCDYFEGMLSLGPYRVRDAGRDMMRKLDEVPPQVARFQVGAAYRLPLWELVYHDCLVAQWYWGDYNNKLPALWDRRDLFNALYATPPMFMMNRAEWDRDRERFVRSYRDTCLLARRLFGVEMTDHSWLAPQGLVQQTRFADGTTVTVNFGEAPFGMSDGGEVGPMRIRVSPELQGDRRAGR